MALPKEIKVLEGKVKFICPRCGEQYSLKANTRVGCQVCNKLMIKSTKALVEKFAEINAEKALKAQEVIIIDGGSDDSGDEGDTGNEQ